jgi:hypothetical protein
LLLLRWRLPSLLLLRLRAFFSFSLLLLRLRLRAFFSRSLLLLR